MEPVWAPHVMQNLSDTSLSLYLEFSCTACIPGGGCTVDRALQVLYESAGDVKLAMERLLSQSGQNFWTQSERELFEELIMLHGKNFLNLSRNIRSKSVKECVEFYYLWKKRPSSRSSLLHPYKPSQPTSVGETSNTTLTSTSTSGSNTPTTSASTTSPSPTEQFPCKVCGRIFEKIKSRSAHMKRHKNERC